MRAFSIEGIEFTARKKKKEKGCGVFSPIHAHTRRRSLRRLHPSATEGHFGMGITCWKCGFPASSPCTCFEAAVGQIPPYETFLPSPTGNSAVSQALSFRRFWPPTLLQD